MEKLTVQEQVRKDILEGKIKKGDIFDAIEKAGYVPINNYMSKIGKKGGESKSEAKKRSSAENGKKGGRPLSMYYLLSGEGECGAWSGPYTKTVRGIRMLATKECCGGDRWCRIYRYEPEAGGYSEHVAEIDSGEMRDVLEVD